MSHHGKNPFDLHAPNSFIRQMMQEKIETEAVKQAQRTLQGEYPNGRLNEEDAGAMALSIGVSQGKIIMRFASSVQWIGFTPEQAIEMANLLITKAREAGFEQPVTLNL